MADNESSEEDSFNLEVEVDWGANNCFDQICWLIKKKLKKKDCRLKKMNHKLERIIDLLETKVEQENTIINQLETKINLETPQPPVICECSISGTAQGNVNPALMGELTANICPDCTIEDSSFNYQVFNPAEQSIRQVIGITFNQVECILDDSGEGTVNITGTSLVRTGVGGPFRTENFTLDLQVSNFAVTSFTINAGNISDTVNIAEGTITVSSCEEC